MKRLIIIALLTLFCTGIGFAATYTIKKNGSVSNGKTTVQKNLYNNYSSKQYVGTNAVNKSAAGIIDIVMDYSGSMSSVVNVAQNTMANVVLQIPSTTQIGFRVFGQSSSTKKIGQVKTIQKATDKNGKTVYKLVTGKHESQTGCQATQLVTPIATANANALISGMKSVGLGGSTPMVLALEKAAYSDFGNISRDIPKKIILITDGGENCGGDPCAFAKTLMNTRRDIQIDVVLVSASSRKLQCLASVTGGKVYSLADAYQFANVITKSINTPFNSSPANQSGEYQNYEFIDE